MFLCLFQSPTNVTLTHAKMAALVPSQNLTTNAHVHTDSMEKVVKVLGLLFMNNCPRTIITTQKIEISWLIKGPRWMRSLLGLRQFGACRKMCHSSFSLMLHNAIRFGDELSSTCQNVSQLHDLPSFSGLHSPERSCFTKL